MAKRSNIRQWIICEPDVFGRFDLFRWFNLLDGVDEIKVSVDGLGFVDLGVISAFLCSSCWDLSVLYTV